MTVALYIVAAWIAIRALADSLLASKPKPPTPPLQAVTALGFGVAAVIVVILAAHRI